MPAHREVPHRPEAATVATASSREHTWRRSRCTGMDKDVENRKLEDDERAWVLIALIDIVATVAVLGFYLWYSGLVAT